MSECNVPPYQHPCRASGVGPSCFNPINIPIDSGGGGSGVRGLGGPSDTTETSTTSELPPNIQGKVLEPCCDDCEYPDGSGDGTGGSGDGTDDGGNGEGGDAPETDPAEEGEPGFTVDPGTTVPDGNDQGDKAKKKCIEDIRRDIDEQVQKCLCECFTGVRTGNLADDRPGQSQWCWGYCIDSVQDIDFKKCFCQSMTCGGGPGDEEDDTPDTPKDPTDKPPGPKDPRYEENQFGPEISEVSFPGSTYDEVIPLVYNRGVLGGNIIWASEARVVKKCIGEYAHESDGTLVVISNRVTQTYVDFALALCEGTISGIARIWIGDNLVYNNTIETDAAGVVTNTGDGSVVTTVENITMFKKDEKNLDKFDRTTLELRVYTGSEDQPVDPAIFAQYRAAAPAFRGVAYIMFKNFELTGNNGSIPALKIEVIRNAQNIRPKQISALVDSDLKDVKPDLLWFDEPSRRLYVGGNANVSSYKAGIREVNYDTLEEVAQFAGGLTPNAPNEDFDHTTFIMSPRGHFVVQTGATGGTRPVVAVSTLDGYGRSSYGLRTGNVEHTTTSIADYGASNGHASGYARIRLSDRVYYDTLFLVSDNDQAFLIERSFGNYTRLNAGQGMNFTTQTAKAFATAERTYLVQTEQDAVPHKSNDFYIVTQPTSGLSSVVLYRGTAYSSEGQFYSTTAGLDAFTLDAALWGRRTNGSVMNVIADARYSALFVFLRFTDGTGYVVKWNVNTETTEWATELVSAPPYSSAGARATTETSKFYHYIGGDNKVYALNKRSGVVVEYADLVADYGLAPIGGAQFYDTLAQTITYITNNNQIARVFVGRIFTGTTALSDIVTDIMTRSGLEAYEYDTTGLEGIEVHGYVISSNVTMRAALTQLGVIYDFIPRQRDYQIVFTETGYDTGEALSLTNLEPGSQEVISRVATVDADAFHSARVQYYDIDAAMGVNTQVVTSAIQPPRGQENTGQITVNFPFASDAAFAMALGERLLNDAAFNAEKVRLRAGPSMVALEPGDYVTVYIDGVLPQVYLVITSTIGADRTNDLELVRRTTDDVAVALSPTPPIITNAGSTSEMIPLQPARAIGFPTNIVKNDDAREGYEAGSGLYGGVVYTGDDPYVPRSLYIRAPTGVLATAGTPTRPMDVGTSLTILPPSENIGTDNETELVIRFAKPGAYEVFVDGSDAETFFENDYNNMLYVGGELLQFREYSIDGDGVTYRFRKLLRGRHSTEYYMGNHVAYEVAAAYSDDSWVLCPGTIVNDEADQFAVAVKIGMPSANKFVEDVYTVDHDFVKFFAPSNLRRTVQANGDFILSANFRVRKEDITTDLNDSPTPEAVFGQVMRYYILSGAYDEATFIAALEDNSANYIRTESTFGSAFTYSVSMQVADGFNRLTDTLHVVAFVLPGTDTLIATPRSHPNYRAIKPEYTS